MTTAIPPDTGSFSPRTEHLLSRAAELCDAWNVRLTTLRRYVLGLMLESQAPLGAYDLLSRLQTTHPTAAPPTVYRTLDFLLEAGLVHKIERLSSFVACTHILSHTPCCEEHGIHATQFLICSRCSHVTELEDPRILTALMKASEATGFRISHSTIEIEGLCQSCARAAPQA